jgi:integrase/recombinase XerC
MEIDEAIMRFVNDIVARKVTEATVSAYRSDINEFKMFLKTQENSVNNVEQLTNSNVLSYMINLSDKVDKGNLSLYTKDRKFYSTKTFFNTLYKLGIIDSNPLEKYRYIKTKRKKFTLYLTDEEMDTVDKAIIDSASKNKYRDRMLFILMRNMGLDMRAITNIKWEGINLSRGVINIPGYGDVEKRSILMTDRVREELVSFYKISEPKGFLLKSSFTNDKLSSSGFKSIIKNYKDKTGIDKVTASTYSATFINRCKQEKVADRVILEITGKKKVETLDYYSDVIPENAIKAVK